MRLKLLVPVMLSALCFVAADRAQQKAPAAAAMTAELSRNVPAPHIQLAIAQSARAGAPGSHITLFADVKLPAGVHVYAPGAKGYRATELRIQPSPDVVLAAAAYPKSKELYLEAIQEKVPVYEDNFRITQDVAVSFSPDFIQSLGHDGKTVGLNGEFRYQACDASICYIPAAVPVTWQLQVVPRPAAAPEPTPHK